MVTDRRADPEPLAEMIKADPAVITALPAGDLVGMIGKCCTVS